MNKNFCERLKILRTERMLSQPELAELVGVSKGMISFWENGINEPTISNLIKLCQIFNISSDLKRFSGISPSAVFSIPQTSSNAHAVYH